MSANPSTAHLETDHDFAHELEHLWEHLSHILPSQASIRDFVHHNTLHGFQHLPFPEALKAARDVTGAYGYLPAAKFREYFQRGRIDAEDLTAVLNEDSTLECSTIVAQLPSRTIYALDIYRTALIYPIDAITQRQLVWQMEARHALRELQYDLPFTLREQLQHQATAQGYANLATALEDLWRACTEVLHLSRAPLHPEALLARTPTLAPQPDPQLRHQAQQHLQQLIREVGSTKTLRQLLMQLLGVDILTEIRPLLLRYLGYWLDQGMASTQAPANQGFYQTWKQFARLDLAWLVEGLPDWNEHLDSLPDDPAETIQAELRRLDIPRHDWMHYLEHLATELPGWSGMVLWRQQRPHYDDLPRNIQMQDYLAVRLVLEHLLAKRLCRQHWLIDASLSAIRAHAQRHPIELWVQYHAYQGDLPEYLQILAQQHLNRQREQHSENVWHALAHHLWHWQQQYQHQIEQQHGHQINQHGWRLFRLAQHLGLSALDIRALQPDILKLIFTCLDRLDEERSGYLWLQAYERHYRELLFSALSLNHTPPNTKKTRPSAQIIFCMDDREEGFRRHLEELNPSIETLGAAAFFNLPMNWQGLDHPKAVKLCPVPVTPEHIVLETAAPNVSTQQITLHQQRIKQHRYWQDRLHQITRSHLFDGTVAALTAAPLALGVLLNKSFQPRAYGQWIQNLVQRFDAPITTRVQAICEQSSIDRSATQNQIGFTLPEQAKMVGDFLQAHGLAPQFASLVVMMGHYSSNQNNPHQAAYGCGACSGRYSGPNGRTFATMANNAEVRHLLAQQGIMIPDDCWFIGAEHDTCNEDIYWFDTDLIPASFQAAFVALQTDLQHASQHSAHERCRKLMSAPRTPTPFQAWQHMLGRSMDYSQPRPELGHATNAAAFIGRRAMSQGVFFDRRTFLISYDYQTDPTGALLERILLSVGPVGAGISLEYYFSMVSNNRYGAGSKVTHNLIGLLGVMEGASSDLRTGLPKQMIEIHEAMRLLLVLECQPAIVSAIYQRQAILQELIGNSWVQLAVKDPMTGEIYHFKPDSGFERWTNAAQPLATVTRSAQWYDGHSDHLSPALISTKDPNLC